MARASSYNHLTKMLFIAAVSGLDAPYLARRGVLARALLVAPGAALAGVVAPGAANAGIADQLEAASRASEITYSQNGKKHGAHGRRRQFNGCQEEHFLGAARHETAGDHGLQIWQGPGPGALRRRSRARSPCSTGPACSASSTRSTRSAASASLMQPTFALYIII